MWSYSSANIIDGRNIYVVVLVLGNCLSLDALRLLNVTNLTFPMSSTSKLPKVNFSRPVPTSPAQQPPVTHTVYNAQGHAAFIPTTLHQNLSRRASGRRRLAQAGGQKHRITLQDIPTTLHKNQSRRASGHNSNGTTIQGCDPNGADYSARLDLIVNAGQTSQDNFVAAMHDCGVDAFAIFGWEVVWADFLSCVRGWEEEEYSGYALSDACIGCFHMEAQYGADNCMGSCSCDGCTCKGDCLECIREPQQEEKMVACMGRPPTGKGHFPRSSCCDCR
eukprot:gnl/TRDRNA2_/TRDRNA2_193141_c0_seq1.p1 gnl/TRDRNA2_/TRDRNA2_193141_c0~~gnl/TRDRNA2_/TRDRNA2_193141_c0_seq1.p1  ORF type:complete len:277 (+),score=8.57 gnl/TRDRNA2_/TRDRNA2_193141_c0_seq1:65-895(+)